MDLTKHKKWIKDYLKENYVITGTDTPNGAIGPRIDFCDDQIFIIENWDSRINILSDQVPFMKKDKFCKFVKYGTDRDGSYYHYRFEFPFEYVNDEINKNKNEYTCEYALENGRCTVFSGQIDKLVNGLGDQMGINIRLREAIAFATGRLDIVPQTNEGKLCIEVREYLLNVLKEIL